MAQKKVKPVGSLVIASKIKAIVKTEGLRTGKDFLDALSRSVNDTVQRALESTRNDRRMTLGAEDVPS